MHLRGATALVTGAAQGLGKAFSEALLKRGVSVCLSDVQEQKGKEVEKEFQSKYGKDKASFIQCDVRSEDNLSRLFKEATSRFGQIDVMVNNAGIADEIRVKDTLDINLFAVIRGTQLAVDHMRTDEGGKGGLVINVASTAGLTPVYFSPVYVASKHGVAGFTNSLASNPHNKEMGVQFACLCPAFTDTPILDTMNKTIPYLDEAKAIIRRIGVNEVEEVVKAFMLLVEPQDTNGDVIVITKKEGIYYNRKNGKRVKAEL